MSKAIALVLLLVFSCGCGLAYRRSHHSPLLVVFAGDPQTGEEMADRARSFEDAIIDMADEFGVPLEDIIPVRVYASAGPAKRSYYNAVTGSIVIRDGVSGRVLVHELSHLLAHRIERSPHYWSDQSLAEYMEEKYGRNPGGSSTSQDAAAASTWKTRDIMRRIGEASGAGEILAHLTPEAIDEERSWGPMIVRYLFESRWAGERRPEKVRRLLRMRMDDVAMLAEDIIAWYRRPDLLAESSAHRGG
jgi:hypothetical protein